MRALRRAGLAAIVVAAVVAVAGCTASGPSSADPRLEGTWYLAAASVAGRGLALGDEALTLTIGDATHTGGTAPCSSYSARVTGGIGVVYIQSVHTGGLRDQCISAELQRLAQQFFDALDATQYATINQGALVLTSARSTLVFAKTPLAAIPSLKKTSWQLFAIQAVLPSVTPGLTLLPIGLRFNGTNVFTLSSVCGTTSVTYGLNGTTLTIGRVVSAHGPASACTPADRAVEEQATAVLNGPLLVQAGSGTSRALPMLITTSLSDNLPIVWRAVN